MDARFTGTHVAIVTPFRRGALDEEGLRRMARHCLDGGVDGLVPCGTTGEAATLTEPEFCRVVEIALQEAGDTAAVIAGTGTNATATTIARTRLARELGCTAALVVTPYYNKPTPEGLIAHYTAITQAVPGFPLVLYNVPSRTSVNMQPETVEALSTLPEIVAVKEACGDLGQVQRLLQRVGERIAVLSGDDALALPMYALGAVGVISVAGNVAPREMSALYRLHCAGDTAAAARAQRALFPLFEALFWETNPAPCKAALAMMGLIEDELRLPLVPVRARTRDALRPVLDALKLLRHE